MIFSHETVLYIYTCIYTGQLYKKQTYPQYLLGEEERGS